jgi:hypothetical protein
VSAEPATLFTLLVELRARKMALAALETSEEVFSFLAMLFPFRLVLNRATSYFFLPHRDQAAFLAMARLRATDRLAARAIPPLEAPSFDKATAAGFLVSGATGVCLVAS